MLSVTFSTCDDSSRQEDVLTVLDGLTGQVRFVLPFSCGQDRVSLTDHVLVVDRVAYDIRTGERKWSVKGGRKFLPGQGSSSRLVVAADISAADDPVPGCRDCMVRPMEVVSDQDPEQVVAQLDHAVGASGGGEQPLLSRGWGLTHDPEDGANRWVNIETMETFQAPHGDPRIQRSLSRDGFLSFYAKPSGENGTGEFQMLDSWSGRVGTPLRDRDMKTAPLAENVWVVGIREDVTELSFSTRDGEPLAQRIPLPAVPEGLPSDTPGGWEITDTVRTRDGGATLLRWSQGEIAKRRQEPACSALGKWKLSVGFLENVATDTLALEVNGVDHTTLNLILDPLTGEAVSICASKQLDIRGRPSCCTGDPDMGHSGTHDEQ